MVRQPNQTQQYAQQKQSQHNQDGFSSDSQALLERERQSPEITDQLHQEAKQQVKLYLQKPQQVKERAYSLQPDIQTGWTLKKQLPKPIPLLFENQYINNLVSKALKNQTFKCRLIYLGPRYDSTLLAWHNKVQPSPYQHITFPTFPKFSRRQFCGQKRGLPLDILIFDSHFQSGNLDSVFKVGTYEYQLFIRVDSNTRGHNQWFNFKVRNLKKGQRYIFKICNLTKKNTLFTRGCKPYFLSSRKSQKQNIQWHQYGQKIKYQQKLSKTAALYEVQSNHYILTFQFEVQYDDDQIQIAYSIPYTYSELNYYLQRLIQKQKKKYLSIAKLCSSLGGLQVPLIIVDNTDSKSEQKVKCIIVSGRAHPGQANGSHMMQGFIDFICGNSKEAQKLRKNIIFKIVPMLNPDGVVIGNHRTGLSGKDFNRDFSNPNKKISPEVFALKKLVSESKELFGEDLIMFLDFHGHSVKKNVFMYGPEFPVGNKNYYQCRVFPKILAQTTKLFRFYSCVFRISSAKQSTARVVMLRGMRIPLSFTVQASNGSYYDYQALNDNPFSIEKWSQMGYKIGEALSQYNMILIEKQRTLIKLNQKKAKVCQNSSKTQKRVKKQSFCIQSKQKHDKSMPKYESLMAIDSLLIKESQEQDLIRQITKFEKEQSQNVMSDDQFSQSSSDREGDEDDLDFEKMQQLYQLLLNKNHNSSLTYNNMSIEKFLNDKTENKKSLPIWMKKLHVGNHRNGISSHSKSKKQSYRKLSSDGNNVQKSSQFNIIRKKNKEQRVVSFGTSFIDFQSQHLEQGQRKADKIYQEILQKRNSTFYVNTGFLPNKRKQIYEKTAGLKKTQYTSPFYNNSEQIYTGSSFALPSHSVASSSARVKLYCERQMDQILKNQKTQYLEPKKPKYKSFESYRSKYKK